MMTPKRILFRAWVRSLEALTMMKSPRRTLNLEAGCNLPDRLDVITVAFNSSELIRVQYQFLQKNLKDKYQQIIVDNSTDEKVREEIFDFCEQKGLVYFGLPKNLLNKVGSSYSHAMALNYTYRHLIRQRRPFAFGQIDHDLFPIAPISIVEKIRRQPVYGPFRHRERCWYLSAIMTFFCYDWVASRKVDFMPVMPDKVYLDSGGGNWYGLYSQLDRNALEFPTECIEALREGGDRHGDSLEYFDEKRWLHTINGSCWKAVNRSDEKAQMVKQYLSDLLLK